MSSVSVCLSTDLIVHHGDISDKQIVIIDILRATSCMLSAFMAGAEHIRVFDNLDECRKMKSQGYLIAGERDGIKVEDFDLGNSPYDYINYGVIDEKIAMTTTNGTKAIIKSSSSDNIFIGSFLNVEALSIKLKNAGSPALLFCAGWKGRPNTEDSLFAGMVISYLIESNFGLDGDEALMCFDFYKKNEQNIYNVLKNSAHAKRLARHTDIQKDLEYCSQINKSRLVPVFMNNEIRPA